MPSSVGAGKAKRKSDSTTQTGPMAMDTDAERDLKTLMDVVKGKREELGKAMKDLSALLIAPELKAAVDATKALEAEMKEAYKNLHAYMFGPDVNAGAPS